MNDITYIPSKELFSIKYLRRIKENKENAILIHSTAYYAKTQDKMFEDGHCLQKYIDKHFEDGIPESCTVYLMNTASTEEEQKEFCKEFGLDKLIHAPCVFLFKDGESVNECFLADGSDLDDIIRQIMEL